MAARDCFRRHLRPLRLALLCVLLLSLIRGNLPVQAASSDVAGTVQHAYFYRVSGESVASVRDHAAVVFFGLSEASFVHTLKQSSRRPQAFVYFMAAQIEGPANARTAAGACDANDSIWTNSLTFTAGSFCREVHPHESWFLHTSTGQRLRGTQSGYGGTHTFYFMDIGDPGYQQWASERMAMVMRGPARDFDGIFLDNVELSLQKVTDQVANSTGSIREYTNDTAYRAAWARYLKRLSGDLRGQYPLWGNMIAGPNDGSAWNDYLPYLDGAMDEAFAAGWPRSRWDATRWDRNLRQVEYALGQGKQVTTVVQGDSGSNTMETFGLASYFLITRGDQATFRYSQYTDYENWHQYTNFTTNLGAPRGDRYQLTDGRWRRDFANGTVIVDPVRRTASISANSSRAPARTPVPPSRPQPLPQPTPIGTTQTGTTHTVALDADAQTSAESPTAVQGRWDTLNVDGNPQYTSYVRFRLANLDNKPVQQVLLHMYVTSGGAHKPLLQRTASDWDDRTLTWQTRPATLGKRIDLDDGGLGSNAWVDLDITPLINGAGTYSIALTMATADGVIFASMQSEHAPKVIITTKP